MQLAPAQDEPGEAMLGESMRGASGQAKLLDMTYARLRFSTAALPLVAAVIVGWYSRNHDATWLTVWGVAYLVFAVAMRWLYTQHYLPDKARLGDAALYAKWLRILSGLAMLHGLGLTSATAIMVTDTSFEVSMLWHVTLVAILAGNATHQTPVLRVFMIFFMASWNLNLLLLYWTFPEHWQYLLPLSLLFSLGIYRHAITANKFFVRQIQLQEYSQHLAAQYRSAKETAEAALQAKNQFLTTASHDLRQPVHAMGMLVEAIARQNDNPRLMPLMNDLRSSIRSINLMFNSLLDLSRIELRNTQAQCVPVALSQLVAEVATVFGEDARSHQLSLRVHLPRTPAWVQTDPHLVRQALTNLVHNALRYTTQGGVLIALRLRAGQWQLQVWDTGMGVADAEQERIFSPYFRNENAWNADRSGFGLGLHVVARCAQLLGADYGLRSRLERGTRFWLTLPASATLNLGAAPLINDPPNQQPLAALAGRCLVLEDDPLLLCAMQALLQGWGVDSRFATHAAPAFALLDSGFQPQAILCDQRLRSGESGFDILRDLLARCPQASGAMMSGEFDSPALAQAEAEGYLVLRKPMAVSELHALLERWFHRD